MPDQEERLFPALTVEQIDRARKYGEMKEFGPGDALFTEGDPVTGMFIILSGQVRVTRRAGNDETTLVTHGPGAFTGELTIISGGRNIATGTALTEVSALHFDVEALKRLFNDDVELRSLIVPAMAARRPEADAMVMQREKLAALGKLSAGLAHELNNPASAASRASSQLADVILRQMAQAICMSGGCDDKAAVQIKQMLDQARRSNSSARLSALDRSDREDEMAAWLDAHEVIDGWRLAPDLVDSGVTCENLNALAALLPPQSVGKIASWLASTVTSLSLITQIEASTTRMSELVQAIKSFSYMDQGSVQEVDVHLGLDSTLTILGHKLKNVQVERDYDSSLPKIVGRGGDLNQVWANLIDNAIDAMDGANCQISVKTYTRLDEIVVEISDNGSGIPEDVQAHIFEPFFTTKGVGKGTGLGLDTVYRIVVDQHRGDISVDSKPGSTTFRVCLPINRDPDPSSVGAESPVEAVSDRTMVAV